MSDIEGAYGLAKDLMRHDPSDPFRQGYTLGNALIAVARHYSLSPEQTAVVAEKLTEGLVEYAAKVSTEFTEETDTTRVWSDNEDLADAIFDLRHALRLFGYGTPDNAFDR